MTTIYETVTDLVRGVGLHNLCNFDGCVCSHFSVRGVDITIGCHKGNGYPDYSGWGIKVEHGGGDYDSEYLRSVALEVFQQLSEPHSKAAARIVCSALGERIYFDVTLSASEITIENHFAQSYGPIAVG